MNNKPYQNLTDFLLDNIRQRPAMYLKEPRLSSLSTFLMGYSVGQYMSKQAAMDDFFGDNGFIQWLLRKKNNAEVPFWEIVLMEEASNDEYRALELFFDYLEEFRNEGSEM